MTRESTVLGGRVGGYRRAGVNNVGAACTPNVNLLELDSVCFEGRP
jgi:hypothetical protein